MPNDPICRIEQGGGMPTLTLRSPCQGSVIMVLKRGGDLCYKATAVIVLQVLYTISDALC
jgi:hypothetical protein